MTAAPAIADIVAGNLPHIAALCRRCRVRRLDLFGSAATGRFDAARSDLDFVVSFDDMPLRPYVEALGGLRSGLEALFGRPIDLLTDDSLRAPYLRRQIEFEKRPLYVRPS